MDIFICPDILTDKAFKSFLISCIDYVRYEGLIDCSTHDKATNALIQLFRDNFAFEMFIRDIKHNCSLELERSKKWL